MARQSDHNAAARVEPDQIARMDGRRPRELSVRGQLAQRLKGFRGRTRAPRPSAGNTGRPQRVVVKTHVSRHKPGKARGSLTRHASYLGRDSASADGQPGVFYDRTRDEVNAKQEVAAWVADRHHFRVIISPERGEDIPDMTRYVRDVMARVEKDLGTRLNWVGINHHNTDNPHAHVVIRGRREDGTDLVIPREYLSNGMRRRAVEVATELLGERTVEQVQEAKRKEVEAERFTLLDRMIQRHLDGGRIDVSPSKPIGFAREDRTLVVGRLQFLATLGLAQKDGGTWWSVQSDFGPSLRELGARHDIVKQLYSTLGTEAGRVQRMGAGGATVAPVVGIVVAKGSADEVSDDRFVVVRDAGGAVHYGRVPDGAEYRSVRVGAIAELGAAAHFRRQVARDILAISQAHGGTYSPEAHAAHLRSTEPARTEEQIASRVRSAAARLTFVAGHEGTGVRAQNDGTHAVDQDAFTRFSQRGGARTDVRAVTAHTLADQVESRAFTWLDRQAFGRVPDTRLTAHPAVQEAVARRQEWLVSNGYGRRNDGPAPAIQLVPGARNHLIAEERSVADRQLAERHGRRVIELPPGGLATGKYQGTEQLHAGKRAMVVTEDAVYVAPVRRAPELAKGGTVTLRRTGTRDATVEAVAGQSQGAGAQKYLGGLEAGR